MFYLMIVCLGVLVYFVARRNSVHMYMLYLFLAGFTIYSGIGIVLYRNDKQIVYLMNFVLFCLSFIAMGVYSIHHRPSNALYSLKKVIYRQKLILNVLAMGYLLTFLYPFFVESIGFSDLFNVRMLFVEYAATPFALRLARRADPLYVIITNQVKSITAPFFYLYLFRLRKRPVVFCFVFLIPIYLQLIADGYMSRNNLAVNAAFLVMYLIMEGYLSKKLAIIIGICFTPIVLSVFTMLANVRQGGTLAFSFGSIIENIQSLIASECSYPIYYDYCASMTSVSQTINFFIYIAVICIPSALYSFIGIKVPNLAYSFTEAILGMKYGAKDYYILLPSVLGEAIILFGSEFAWIYGFFYGLLAFWFLRVLSSQEELKFLRLSFMLDFFRQFRGGSQYVLSSWLTKLLPMIVIIYILGKFRFVYRGNGKG